MKFIPKSKFYKTRFSIRVFSPIIFGVIFIFSVQKIAAYDNDTHFWLTYYLAVKSGYSSIQATQIASATIDVDFDKHTTPVLPSANFRFDIFRPNVYVQNVRIDLHALPLRKSLMDQFPERNYTLWDPIIVTDSKVLEYSDKLALKGQIYRWDRVLEYKDNPGIFLHYLQDKYAHRGFFSVVGHAGYEYVDFLASAPKKAEMMVKDTVNYLIEFKKIQEGNSTINSNEYISNNWQLLDKETWSEILTTLNRFIDVNPSPGIEETQLLKKWKSTNKFSVLKQLYNRWKNAKLPDSTKARAVVKEQLKMSDDELPWIWLYDLRQGGFPIENTKTYKSSKILAYRKVNVRENLQEKKAKNLNGKLLCLPWKVVSSSVSTISLCSK